MIYHDFMKKLVTLFLLVSSMFVFAFANSVKAHHDLTQTVYEAEGSLEQHKLASLVKENGQIDLDNETDASDDECFCKERSKTTSFICGMVLAPASQYDHALSIRSIKERFQFHQADRLKSFVSIQKRPPRTTL